jgi:hypothetical protein
MLRKTGFVLGLAVSVLVAGNTAAADTSPVLDAQISTGVDPDATAIGRLHAGGMLVFDDIKLAVDAHLAFSAFLRIDDSKGIQARSFSPLNLGVRYAIRDKMFGGPYIAAGAGFGFLSGKPRERKVSDMETCATAGDTDNCTFDIKQQINTRLGLGWGFRAGKKITVGVRLDLTYFMFNVSPGEDQPRDAPIAREIPRPQGTWAVLIGLEFMRWR